MPQSKDSPNSNVLSWTSLALSLVAIVLSIASYNRSGEDIEREIRTQIQQLYMNTKQQAADAQAEAELAALRSRIEAQEAGEEIADEVGKIQADLSEAYEDAQGAMMERGEALDEALLRLEQQVREGSSDATETLEEVLARLRETVEPKNN